MLLIEFFTLRQSKAKAKESALVEERWINLEARLRELDLQGEQMNAQIKSLSRLVYSLENNDNTLNNSKQEKGKK